MVLNASFDEALWAKRVVVIGELADFDIRLVHEGLEEPDPWMAGERMRVQRIGAGGCHLGLVISSKQNPRDKARGFSVLLFRRLALGGAGLAGEGLAQVVP
jgi:hypothetical protein